MNETQREDFSMFLVIDSFSGIQSNTQKAFITWSLLLASEYVHLLFMELFEIILQTKCVLLLPYSATVE